jgi:hypothetical protein
MRGIEEVVAIAGLRLSKLNDSVKLKEALLVSPDQQ